MRPPAETSLQEILREARLYSLNPLVGCIDNFVSQQTVEEIEGELKDVDLQSASVAGLTGAIVTENRTAENCKILHGTIPAVDEVLDKISSLFKLKCSLCEYPEFISYQEGGEFKLHFDASLSGSMPSRETDTKTSSQRVFTGMLYLNQDFSGGTTRFPRLDIELQPKRGRLVFWQNTKPGTAKVHPFSMHQGCPVTKGNKRIITFWFRDNPWEPVNTA